MTKITRSNKKANFSGMAKRLSNKELLREVNRIKQKRPSSYWYNSADKREFNEELKKRRKTKIIRKIAGKPSRPRSYGGISIRMPRF